MPDRSVTFIPDSMTVTVPDGETLLRAAHVAGVHINSSCGGQGTCGKCRVRVTQGETTGTPDAMLPPDDFARGYRLACLSRVKGPIVVEIPPESRLHRGVLDHSVSGKPTGRLASRMAVDALPAGKHLPIVEKKLITVDEPTTQDNASDASRTLRALKKQHGLDGVAVDYQVARRLAHALREKEWTATATILFERGAGPLERRPRLINIEPGDETGRHFAVAIDLGTTTVCGELVNMTDGTVAAEASDYNGQIKYGDDVITRMVYAQKDDGLVRLQKAAVDTINLVIDRLLEAAGADRESVSYAAVSGNTVMTHILLGLDPRHIRSAPYTPTIGQMPPFRAQELGIDLPGHAYLYPMPMISSYVGGDIVSGVLASGLYRRGRNTLFIDIGTNGEIVAGNDEWLVTASCSAGPAFEGGGIRHGMRASAGAIEEIRIDPATCEPVVFTIGDEKPRGICGSGIINIVAELLETGLLGPNGKFNADAATDRMRKGRDGMEYVLVRADRSGIDGEIVITEVDIDNFMRAKGALYAGYQTLLESVGLRSTDLDEVIIAGAFGSYVDIEKSIITGLFPDIPVERFSFIGNGSLAGARLTILSRELLDDAERIAGKMTNFELADNPKFMDHFIAALFFPHTEIRNFPSVAERFNNMRGKCNT